MKEDLPSSGLEFRPLKDEIEPLPSIIKCKGGSHGIKKLRSQDNRFYKKKKS